MKRTSILFILFLSLVSTLVNTSNVVFFINAIGKSHLDFGDSLIDSLVERGHVVDVVIVRVNNLVKGHGNSKASKFYELESINGSDWSKLSHLASPFEDRPFTFNGFQVYNKIGNALCESALADQNLHAFLTSRQYDIGVVSVFDYCGIGMLVKSEVPSIATFNALPLLSIQTVTMGLPNIASQDVPLFYSFDLSTLYGKFWNLACWRFLNLIRIPSLKHEQEKIFQKVYGDDFNMDDIIDKVDITFVNSNEVLERPRPLHHRIQYIGGINLKDPKSVNIKVDVDSSDNFGTQIPSSVYPRYAVRNFVKVFKKYPEYAFLWKYNVQPGEEKLFENVGNVILLDWLPQTDLLYDPRVIGFISHVGLNSFSEASYSGKPIIAIPLFADQPYNARNGVARGTTYLLNKSKLTEESIDNGKCKETSEDVS
ncbi:glucuronosyltransferase [Caenorhabditis elegans]|uniref:glucuronosyltransferase n=1 Tax=Caenorhabditis elegans TaxID=6239 RepID=O16510_CAEEL|nr:glucuronosyltransferase [Caenorhabditis elegans]CCD83359.2 glucuronosyltransferase [Caenorhabditis elegans]|eukprot:NP_001343693.1 Uncharacterized protein CELE_C03A7.13 [Caenorhabditis elegans]